MKKIHLIFFVSRLNPLDFFFLKKYLVLLNVGTLQNNSWFFHNQKPRKFIENNKNIT